MTSASCGEDVGVVQLQLITVKDTTSTSYCSIFSIQGQQEFIFLPVGFFFFS